MKTPTNIIVTKICIEATSGSNIRNAANAATILALEENIVIELTFNGNKYIFDPATIREAALSLAKVP